MPSTRAEALTEELARIHTYPHGVYPKLERAIAEYAGVRAGVWVAGAEVSDDDPVLTICCRPNNPTASWASCRARGRSSSTRPTSSTPARPRST